MGVWWPSRGHNFGHIAREMRAIERDRVRNAIGELVSPHHLTRRSQPARNPLRELENRRAEGAYRFESCALR